MPADLTAQLVLAQLDHKDHKALLEQLDYRVPLELEQLVQVAYKGHRVHKVHKVLLELL